MDAKIYHFETPDMHVGKDHLCVNVRNNSKTKFNQTKDHYKLSYKTVGIVFVFFKRAKRCTDSTIVCCEPSSTWNVKSKSLPDHEGITLDPWPDKINFTVKLANTLIPYAEYKNAYYIVVSCKTNTV